MTTKYFAWIQARRGALAVAWTVGAGLVLVAIAGSAVRADPPGSPPAVLNAPLAPAAQEIIGERPSPQHVWIAGHWRWQDRQYGWMAGHWEVPPRANVVWIEPRLESRDQGSVLVEGCWRDAAASPAAPVVAVWMSPWWTMVRGPSL